MKIRHEAVLREFDKLDRSTPEHSNMVFDCIARTPEGEETRFARRIVDSKRSWHDSVIVMDGEEVIGSGEDPRPFFWQGSACISAQVFNPQQRLINKVWIKDQDRWLVVVPPYNLPPGKNWMPFVRGDVLYFVHELSPFRVLKASFIHPRDDFLVLDTVIEHPVRVPVSFDKYSRLRGGANAVQIGDLIVGFGHTNDRPVPAPESITHRPFLFVYDWEKRLEYYSFDYEFDDRFRVVDPTSLYRQGDRLYLVTCETEYAWQVTPQKGRICLYSIDIAGEPNESGFGLGGRRLHWWPHDKPSKIRRLLGAWGRPEGT